MSRWRSLTEWRGGLYLSAPDWVRQSMIPKSGTRFSKKIMLKQKDKRRV
jgi:hypothetical protein